MLKGRFIDDSVRKWYCDNQHSPKETQLYISLGIAREFDISFKPYVFINLKKPFQIAGKEITDIGVTIHNFDPHAAPQGKTVVTIMLPVSNTEYWVNMRDENRAAYRSKKGEIAEKVIGELESYFGDIKEKVEMVDVATPASYVRYAHNWYGAPSKWQDPDLLLNKPKKEVRGLKNFLMCGQWVGDGGLCGASKSGRDIAQILCKKDGKKFTIIPF